MKNFFEINRALVAKKMMILMAVALIALPTMAQQDQWQSTSSLPTSGSTYSPQVTAVGASVPAQQSAVGAPYTPAQATGGPRRMGESGRNPGDVSTGSTNSPLGDGLIPLSLLALAYAGVVYFRKRKQTLNG